MAAGEESFEDGDVRASLPLVTTITMRLVWVRCGAGWFGVTWRVVVCCGAAWCGFVWCGWLGVDSGCLLWVSTLGLYTVCLNWRLDRAGWAHRKAGWMGATAQ